jgi:hypothetical protein
LKHSVDVHVRVAAATQDLLKCDDMKRVLDTGVLFDQMLFVARDVMRGTGAFVARTFVGARSARTFLFDKENNVLLYVNRFPASRNCKSVHSYPTPLADSGGLTGFITETSPANSRQNQSTDINDYDGRAVASTLHSATNPHPAPSKTNPVEIPHCNPGLDSTPFKPEEHMPSHVIATAAPCNLADAPSDARFGGLWFLAGIHSPWAAMCVPVADPGTGEMLGCVMVEGRGEDSEFGYFGHDDVQSLRSIAVQLAAAIKRCR